MKIFVLFFFDSKEFYNMGNILMEMAFEEMSFERIKFLALKATNRDKYFFVSFLNGKF